MKAAEIREMLRAMQAGELTVSRGIELVDMWLAGNYRDDMLPPVRDGLGEDEMPWDRIDALTQQRDELLAAWKESNEALGLLSFHCDGVVGTANPPHEIYNKTYDIYRRHQAAIAKVKP